MSPLDDVKQSCQYVQLNSKSVKINLNKLQSLAMELLNQGSYSIWSEDNIHYDADVKSDGILTCQYIFVLDSLNFCFWPNISFEYDVLASNLKRVLLNDSSAFNADRLASLNSSDIVSWFPAHDFPLLDERVERLNELGRGLLKSKSNN